MSLLATVFLHPHAQALDYNWDAGGANTNWSTADNWAGNITPPSDGTHTINFQGVLPTPITSTVDAPFNIQKLIFDTASLVTLGGSTLTIQGVSGTGHDGDVLIENKQSAIQTFNNNLTLAKGGIIRGAMVINGNIANNSTVAGQEGLRFTGSAAITVNGIISSSGAGDTVALNGATVTFNNVNTFTRNFTVWGGTARAGVNALSGVAGAFGNSTNAITVGHGGSSGATILAANAITIGRSLTLNASGNAGFSFYTLGGDTAHTSNFTGTITNGNKATTSGVDYFNAMAIRLTAATNGRVNFNGNFVRASTATGSNDNVSKEGGGIVAINGTTNTWEGTTSVNNGVLYVNGTLQANASGKGITVASSAAFGGTGTASRSVTLLNNAVLAPGDAGTNNGIGRLTIGYSLGTALTLHNSGGSILNFQVTSTSDVNSLNRFANLNDDGSMNWGAVLGATQSPTLNNDTLVLQGNLVENTTGRTTINFSLAGGGTLYSGMVWDIMDWQTVNGAAGPLTFERYNFVVDPTLAAQLSGAGLALDTSRFWDTGYVGITPEPGRAMLFGMGVMAMLMRRSRRK